jgi:RNA polymerase sigma-70 factor (ECF subfamily)
MANESPSAVSKPLGTSDLGTEAGQRESVEVELVRRAQSGDSEAFAELVRKYQRRTVSLAYRLLGNVEDASDVSQEAFIRAFRHLSQLDDPSRFGAWLLRVVSNLSLNYRRSRRSRSAAPLDDVTLASAEARSPTSGQRMTVGLEDEGGPLPDELQAAINTALESLPDKQRLALVLFSVEGMPQKQVAEILECSVELVKWNVFQARQKLKEKLKDFL